MKRSVIAPAVLAGAALDELKEWLGITTPRDDAGLAALLRAALETCEAFTGLMPLAATCEEIIPASTRWQSLATRPVQAITGAESVASDGGRAPIAPADYAIDVTVDGGAVFRLTRGLAHGRVAVRFTAGMAAGWSDLPDGLRHGAVRLAAHHYRQREDAAKHAPPPAAVAALWRPWRRLRLA